jgi:hypothetical protein
LQYSLGLNELLLVDIYHDNDWNRRLRPGKIPAGSLAWIAQRPDLFWEVVAMRRWTALDKVSGDQVDQRPPSNWTAWLWGLLSPQLDVSPVWEWGIRVLASAAGYSAWVSVGAAWWHWPIAIFAIALTAEAIARFVRHRFRRHAPVLIGCFVGLGCLALTYVIREFDPAQSFPPRVVQVARLNEKRGQSKEGLRDLVAVYCDETWSPSLRITGQIYLPELSGDGRVLLKTKPALCFGASLSAIIPTRVFDVSSNASRQDAGIAGAAFRQQIPLLIPDVYQIEANAPYAFRIFEDKGDEVYPIHSLLVVPIFRSNRFGMGDPIGVLCLASPEPGAFSEHDLHRLLVFNQVYVSDVLAKLIPSFGLGVSKSEVLIAATQNRR